MNNSTEIINNYLAKEKTTLDQLDHDAIQEVIDVFLEAYHNQQSFYIFGNGGSGSNASHICGDFIKGVSYGLDKGFRFHCLNDNMAGMMAIANDIDYNDIFVEPVKNVVEKNDVVIGLSGSGNSENVVRALTEAKERGAVTIAFSGFTGGKIKKLANCAIHVPVHDMEVTEDVQLIVFHIIKNAIIKSLHGDKTDKGDKYEQRVNP